MKRLSGARCTMMIMSTIMTFAAFAVAQNITGTASTDLSPAAQRIAAARRTISDKPTEYAGYNLLATALARRAQESSDLNIYSQAEEAIEQSLALAPNNFDTQKIQVSILLGEHEYRAALEAAQALNRRVPDDVMVYGLLTDANVELGNYADAEDAAQWMLNLRPGNLPALTRAAHLRELFGDNEGAYQLMELRFSVDTSDRKRRTRLPSDANGTSPVGFGKHRCGGKTPAAGVDIFSELPLHPGESGPASPYAEALRGSGGAHAATL
jgi:tetratricopeptide (TPR) repeat protein